MSDAAPQKPGPSRRHLVARILLFVPFYAWIGYACFDRACNPGSGAAVPAHLRKPVAESAPSGSLPPSDPVQASGRHSGSLRAARAVEAAAGTVALSWPVLGGFRYSKGMRLPAAVRDLNGKDVSVTGFMLLLDRETRITDFVLVEALWSCCFGSPPDVNQAIIVNAADLGGIDFSYEPVQVIGTLDVGERLDSEGMITSVYRLRAKAVRRLQ